VNRIKLAVTMKQMRLCLLPLPVLMFIPSTGAAQVGVKPKSDFSLKDRSDAKFHVGDVWSYKTRSSEDNSRVTIVKIDESPELGVIIH